VLGRRADRVLRSLVVERRDGEIRPVDAEFVIEARLPRLDGPP
jgi:hypothetical protein